MEIKKNRFWQLPDRKVTVDLVVTVITFLALGFGVELDPEHTAAISKGVGFAFAYIVKNK